VSAGAKTFEPGAAVGEAAADVAGRDASAASARDALPAIYDAHFEYVWRALRALGVAEAQAEDAAQDVFVTAHRRLPEFEGRSSVRTWLYAIALRTARKYRAARKTEPLDAEEVEGSGATPEQAAVARDDARLLEAALAELDYDKREVFVLAELEELTAPQIAEITGAPVNTVYARLRAARQRVAKTVARLRARDRSRR
jgi:RNA polymerase sigma-70 factor (ECF subfamily)